MLVIFTITFKCVRQDSQGFWHWQDENVSGLVNDRLRVVVCYNMGMVSKGC